MSCRWCWCLLLVAGTGAFAQQVLRVITPEGRERYLALRAIGGYSAAGLRDIAKHLWHAQARLLHQGTTLQVPEGTLWAAPQSFFLRWRTADGEGTLQLPVPVRSDGSQLFIPLPSVAEALSILWNAKVEWISPTELRLQRLAANPSSAARTTSPRAHSPTPQISPLPIPPDTSLAPSPRLPLRKVPDSTAPWERFRNWLATLGSSFAAAPTAITRIIAERHGDTLTVRFSANATIQRYQRPEWQGREVVFRIPEVLHAADTLPRQAGIEELRAERIRDIMVYRLRLSSPIRECSAQREGPQTVRLSILLLREQRDARSAEVKRWDLDVIVIDPGHGGKDYGAIGVRGYAEKNITLRVALKLQQLLKRKMPKVRVVLTRSDDRFVPLYRRGQIANEHRGKVFVSLHCNAAPEKPHSASGIETYVLRPGRTPEAIRVAERENAVIRLEADPQRYEGLLEEQHILATLAQSAFMRLSDRLAALIQQELVAATGLPNRGIGQAGFYVLLGASMPAVLVEMGFLSNPREERFLASEVGQWKLARGLAAALFKYAAEYTALLD
ncbi:MAG: N-acetylmuramoyl-L-alanine amidase [Candidatus Kapabacteria bacterium]|nr:N-acetylmuramoyl-L-alanine amidase [Candidatus Kapabacteria bacterium]MDW8012679.1 N-acetylmuramoyl-L-alanine amidase [Bacteroidota bacterium]